MIRIVIPCVWILLNYIYVSGQTTSGFDMTQQDINDLDTAFTPLNEVIIYENRLQIPFAEQNRNINILTREQIKTLPARSVGELLTYLPGVDVRQRGPWGGQADIGIDGGTFEQTMILINGVKTSDPQTAHHNMNIPIPIGAIERIEVIRGPAARIYGINSLTGAINIVTRKPSNTTYEITVNGASSFKSNEEDKGIYHGRGIQLGAGWANTSTNHLIYGSHDSGNGYRYNTPFNNNKIFYQGNIENSRKGIWDFMGGYTFNDFGANAFYAPPNDKEAREIVQTALAAIGYKIQMNDRWKFNPRLNYRYNHDDYRYNQHDLNLFRNLHNSHVINTELNTTYTTTIGVFGAGLEMRNEFLRSSNMGDRERNNYGLYSEYRTDIVNNLSLNLGAYVNYNSDFGWQVYPGLDVGYDLSSSWKLYVNTGTGQRIPSFTDLYTNGGGNIGNPELTSENAWHTEAGIKHSSEKWFLQTNYFFREINDFIDWTRPSVNENWTPYNFLRNRTHGVTFSGSVWFNNKETSKWLGSLAYTYLRPEISSEFTNDQLSKYAIESLRHQLIANLAFTSTHFSFSIAQRFVERISYRNYFLTDIKVGYKHNSYGVYFDANNLFDITYIEASTIPLPGRWFNLSLNYLL
ncbi:TonB-dependent siderophore receptor [Olivibacter sp. SDN3]|uniref:TonB-dependent receptor plug domain-containing protein n=1 Tax=Olivibacter sp. SDN3 TaxID=2764720 RepID=UPI0021062952|nr:TonB-dependent receptor [Olivibacter sp. SDN3]